MGAGQIFFFAPALSGALSNTPVYVSIWRLAMRVPARPNLIRRMLDARLKRLKPRGPVLAASFVAFEHRCAAPQCACQHGGPLHSSQHVTFKERGQKTRSVYVPKDLVKDVRSWIDEHRRLKQLLHEIQQLTLALVRTHVTQRRRKKVRP